MREPAAVVQEFEDALAAWSVELGDRPDELMHRLWLLALERERMVTISYRRDAIEPSLDRCGLDPAIRDLIANAIRWAWRDEESHALWIRGALLREGTLPERLRTWVTQLEGQLGGWTSSRQHHNRWTDAPITRAVAEVLELAGVAAGKIPEAIRPGLQFNSFEEFCRFSVAAEQTAALGWKAMVDLAPRTVVDPGDVDAFARMHADEVRHAQMFGLLAACFDGDVLRADVTVESLQRGIAAVGQRFLPLPQADDAAWRNPLGKGGDVVVVQAGSSVERKQALHDVLAGIGLDALVQPGMTVAVKTTFMLLADRRDLSPSVAPLLIKELGAWLAARGAHMRLIDARNVYDRFFGGRDVRSVAAYLGLGDLDVVDAQDDQVDHVFVRGLGQRSLSAAWRDADLRIGLGKVRGHPTSVAMLGLEALEGLGERHDSHIFGDRKVDRETATLMLLDAFPPHAVVVDAFEDVPDGLLGMMGSGDPRQPLRLYASRDAVAVDAVLARHLGADPDDDRMLVSMAFDWFGDPRPRTTVVGPDTPLAGWRLPDHTQRTALLSRLAMPVYTHASARGALFVPQFDETAFPPRVTPSPQLVAARSAIRALVDPGRSLPPLAELLPIRWDTIDGRALRACHIGDDDAEPVVLLHGYPETLQLWGRLARRLAPTLSVWAFDWPGQGYSDPWDGAAGPSELADQLLRILEHWGLSRVRLVATDMGAPPALLAAARDGERIGSVVVMNSLLFGDAGTSWEIAVMRRAGLQSTAFRWFPGTVYDQVRRTFLRPGEALPDEVDADFRGAWAQPEVRAHIARMCRDYETALPELPQAYWQVRCPVLLLWAEHEAHFDVGNAVRLAEMLPTARRHTVAAAAHWMPWMRADAVAAEILAFFQGDV